MIMGWSPVKAVNAYLETVKLCKLDMERKRECPNKSTDLESTELISALAAGMNAQLIVEVCSSPSASTIALAAAARQTGGRFVCILPAEAGTLQADSVKTMKESGLQDTTEFVIGHANDLLPSYKNVDFSLIDCKTEDSSGLFKLFNVNPSQSVIVANNLLDRTTTAAYYRTFKRKPGAKSITLPIGKGIEVTRIGTYNPSSSQTQKKQKGVPIIQDKRCSTSNISPHAFKGDRKSRWIVHIDERTGEEHVFRVGKDRGQVNSP